MSGGGRISIARAAIVANSVSLLYASHLGFLTAVAVAFRSRRTEPPTIGSTHRIAVCIPAHNEEASIGETVGALLCQDYPSDRFGVHVVADNCSDQTAARASAVGATVHIRDMPHHPGKGPSLNWLIERLDDDVDVIAIVDADTLASPQFLSAIDRAFASGALAVQGNYSVRDPDISAAVGLRYAALACRHHLRPLARTRIGGSSGLYGNGMAFRADVIERHRFSGHLIEDAELQLELLLDGIRVAYAADAAVEAEMPATLDDSRTQNERWELGRAQLVRQFTPRVIGRVIRGGQLPRRTYVDALADLYSPPLSVLTALQVGSIALSCTSLVLRPCRSTRLATLASIASTSVLVAHVFTALRLVQAPRHVYRSLIHAPGLVVWKLALLARVARRPAGVSWTRTMRNAEREGS